MLLAALFTEAVLNPLPWQVRDIFREKGVFLPFFRLLVFRSGFKKNHFISVTSPSNNSSFPSINSTTANHTNTAGFIVSPRCVPSQP